MGMKAFIQIDTAARSLGQVKDKKIRFERKAELKGSCRIRDEMNPIRVRLRRQWAR